MPRVDYARHGASCGHHRSPDPRIVVALALALALCAGAGPLSATARADGDPASDYLVANQVFLSAQSGSPSVAQRRLITTVTAANRAGFAIRVATVPQPYDLGSVTALWRRPRLYARFLGLELASTYRGRLLVAMPDGIGLSRGGRSLRSPDRGLGTVPGATADGLASRARMTVIAVARAAGVALAPGPGAIGGSDRAPASGARAAPAGGLAPGGGAGAGAGPLPWIAAVCALAALVVLAVGLARRRSRWTWPGIALLGLLAFAVPILLLVAVRHRGPAGSPPSADAALPPAAASAAAPPPVQWPPATRAAPDFALRDQSGHAVSVSRFRGRPVLITFVDPLCRNLCPLEAHVLNAAVAALPPARRPAILAVSVDVYADAPRYLRQDVRRWSLVPEWHWAVGSPAALGAVWRRYRVGVSVATRRIGSTSVREITHGELAYVLDPRGDERALFVWPFRPQDVVRELRRLN